MVNALAVARHFDASCWAWLHVDPDDSGLRMSANCIDIEINGSFRAGCNNTAARNNKLGVVGSEIARCKMHMSVGSRV